MKRDLDLIRKMVLAMEDTTSGWAPEFCFEGYTSVEVEYHAYLLIDAGLARGVDITAHDSQSPAAMLTGLTWRGHEFAAAARDETLWKKAMGRVREKTGSITLEVMKELLTTLMRGTLGL